MSNSSNFYTGDQIQFRHPVRPRPSASVRVRSCSFVFVVFVRVRSWLIPLPSRQRRLNGTAENIPIWTIQYRSIDCVLNETYPHVVKTILARPRTGTGSGIPLTRGEVAMLFLDGHAGDGPNLLDIRSQGYGEGSDWDGLTYDDVLNNTDEPPGEAAFVWTKWEPLELWPHPQL